MLPSKQTGWVILLLPIALIVALLGREGISARWPLAVKSPSLISRSPVQPPGSTGSAPRPVVAPSIANPLSPIGSAQTAPGSAQSLRLSTSTSAPDPAAETTDTRFATVDHDLADGNVNQAETLLKQMLTDPLPATSAHATFVLGRTFLANGDRTSAQTTLSQYLNANPQGPDAAAAAFGLARLADQSGARSTAAQYDQRYLSLTQNHALDGYAEFSLAQVAAASGNLKTALNDDKKAIEAGLPSTLESQAMSFIQTNGPASDLTQWYATMSDRAGIDPTSRAHYQLLQAENLRQTGQTDAAIALYKSVLANSSSVTDTNAATNALSALGQAPSSFALGESFMAAAHYDQAITALGDYLDRNTMGADAATARYYRAVALMHTQAFVGAAAQFESFVNKHPSDKRVGAAVLLEGQCLSQAGQPASAAALLEAFAQQHSSDPLAPQALANAIDAFQQANDSAGVATVANQLESAYPSSPYAAQADFIQGWAAYEQLDFAAAATAWQRVLNTAATNPESSPALLWLGKLDQKAGNLTAAKQAFTLAWQANPGDYYAFRARDLANSSSAVNEYSLTMPSATELTSERTTFEAWLADWTKTSPADRKLPYLGAPVAQTSTLERIRALDNVGLTTDVQNEYQQAYAQFGNDPRSLYALADTMSQIGWTPQSLTAAYQLLMISPAPNAFQSPLFLQRLVYPLPYQDLIVSEAQKNGVDPLLLVSLIRQESMFKTHATSPANAIGLTQFMPTTAQGVAASVGLSSFTISDLYLPSIAIKLGAVYLSSQIRAFGGNPFIALAAYNAGGGNVNSWLSDNPHGDLDLFVQEIPFNETREYVKNIYRFYEEYQLLYRTPNVGQGG